MTPGAFLFKINTIYPLNKACRLIGLPIRGDNVMINKLIIGLSQTMADKITWHTLHKLLYNNGQQRQILLSSKTC